MMASTRLTTTSTIIPLPVQAEKIAHARASGAQERDQLRGNDVMVFPNIAVVDL